MIPGGRHIDDPVSLAPDKMVKNAGADTILEACNMANMVGVVQQLGQLARYAHEMFTDLQSEAEMSTRRINSLTDRVQRAAERAIRLDDALANAPEDEIWGICLQTEGAKVRRREAREGVVSNVSRRGV